jgi:arginine-tRNA-protein transferase
MNDDDGFSAAELTIIGDESECSYLPGRRSRFEHRWAGPLSYAQFEALLARGWRRFGRHLFRPICRQCRECRSLRVVLPEVQLTKSQRQCRNRNADVRLIVQPPSMTDEHIRLYNDYHRDMQQRRGWPFRETTEEDYYQSFLDGHFEFSREFLYLRDDRLIGIGMVDMTDRVQSSVYFIHEPQWRDRGPGTFSVLSEIEVGQAASRDYLYMGYYIRDSGSMNYKNRFRTHELLRDYISDSDLPVWEKPDSDMESQ